MKQRIDLRHQMGIIISQAHALWSALLALPETEDAMQAALDRLTATERAQMADYLTMLAQRAYQIRERSIWLRQQLQFGGGGDVGGV
jgi:hypothetical protein